ncbi:MAG: hypothetical protein HFF04_02955 [Oscillospiraceae bacterium]|nr:hypothetical protein [Oscillospiraceae bacterium]
MPEKVMPGPVSDAAGIREAVCVHTRKIMDACRDKDCIEDLRVYLTQSSQVALERASCVKAGQAELLFASSCVEPIHFNRGFYTVDVRYFYRITADAFVGAARPVEISGLAVFDKRVILFGSEGSSKSFSSDMTLDCSDLPQGNQPVAHIEAVDPLVLGMKLVDPCDCGCNCCTCECELSDVPACICSCFGSDLDFSAEGKRLYVSLGQFSLIRLERDTQLLIPAYDYCVPEKECACDGPCEEDPCELFRHVKFPVNEFFPPNQLPNADGGTSCGCCG